MWASRSLTHTGDDIGELDQLRARFHNAAAHHGVALAAAEQVGNGGPHHRVAVATVKHRRTDGENECAGREWVLPNRTRKQTVRGASPLALQTRLDEMAEDVAVDQDRPFEMVRIEGRGHGMVATQDIKAGQLLVEEVPLLDSELVEGAGEDGRLSSTEQTLVDLILRATSCASLVELPPSFEISPDSPLRASGVKRVRDITGAFRKLPEVDNTVD